MKEMKYTLKTLCFLIFLNIIHHFQKSVYFHLLSALSIGSNCTDSILLPPLSDARSIPSEYIYIFSLLVGLNISVAFESSDASSMKARFCLLVHNVQKKFIASNTRQKILEIYKQLLINIKKFFALIQYVSYLIIKF